MEITESKTEPMSARKVKSKSESSWGLRRIGTSIYFSDKITYATAHDLILMIKNCEMDILEEMDVGEEAVSKVKSRYTTVRAEPKPINLFLTTNGGLVHAAFAVVDTIRSLRVPLYTTVLGYVASAGTLISLAGTRRFITPNSFMMIHEIRSGFWGRFSDARVEYENVTKLMEHVTGYYISRTRLTREQLAPMLRTDTDLTAGECVTLGLVDGVN